MMHVVDLVDFIMLLLLTQFLHSIAAFCCNTVLLIINVTFEGHVGKA